MPPLVSVITCEIVGQGWTNFQNFKATGGCRLWNSPEKQGGDALDWMRRRSTIRIEQLKLFAHVESAVQNQSQVSLSIVAFFCPYKHRTNGSIGLLHAEHFRFERARPLLCIAMFRVVFVGQRVEKLFV